jgi:hypothetical protein
MAASNGNGRRTFHKCMILRLRIRFVIVIGGLAAAVKTENYFFPLNISTTLS